ncbi:MAG: hypothetical protein IPO36_13815 [Anaerolineales bacterium]|nr:hypothetical protein [Anaerolineales bacterium]
MSVNPSRTNATSPPGTPKTFGLAAGSTDDIHFFLLGRQKNLVSGMALFKWWWNVLPQSITQPSKMITSKQDFLSLSVCIELKPPIGSFVNRQTELQKRDTAALCPYGLDQFFEKRIQFFA